MWKNVWNAVKKKALEALLAIVTAAIAAVTTTSCMGHGPL